MAHRSWTSITSQSSCHNSLELVFIFTRQQNTHYHLWHSLVSWKYASNNFVACTGPVLLCCFTHTAQNWFKQLPGGMWNRLLPLQWGITVFSLVITLEGNLVILCWRTVCGPEPQCDVDIYGPVCKMHVSRTSQSTQSTWLHIPSGQTQLPRSNALAPFGHWHGSGIIPCK